MIRVAFRYGDSRLFARLVCAVRGGDSAHCEVAWSWAGERHECVSSSWLDDGVRGKSIVMPADKWRIYTMPGDSRHVVDWLHEHDDDGYGVFKLLRFAIGWRVRWGGPVCSTAAADMLGLPEPYLYDPRTLESVCRRFGVQVQ